MATALVTLRYKRPNVGNDMFTVELPNITFMQLMPRIVDIIEDHLFNSLPPNSRIATISLTWDATP